MTRIVNAGSKERPARRVYLAVQFDDGRVIQGEYEAPDLNLRLELERGKRDVTGDHDQWKRWETEPYSTSVDLHIDHAETVKAERPPSWIPNEAP